ncbi:hypothetical protein CDAR_396881, partial [Caerostris darwini]
MWPYGEDVQFDPNLISRK